jgi:hypothetical protein
MRRRRHKRLLAETNLYYPTSIIIIISFIVVAYVQFSCFVVCLFLVCRCFCIRGESVFSLWAAEFIT